MNKSQVKLMLRISRQAQEAVTIAKKAEHQAYQAEKKVDYVWRNLKIEDAKEQMGIL